MQLVILAGGRGTRLRSRLGKLPKPMAPVGGIPILEHQIDLARQYQFDDILLLVGHGREAVESWAGDGSRFSLRLRMIDDSPSRGTAGAVLAAIPLLEPRFLVMYGDTMLNVDLARFLTEHARRGSAISMLIHPNDHPYDSSLVETDEYDGVIGIHAPPHKPGRDYRNQANAGLYVVEREAMAGWRQRDGMLDIAKDLLPDLISRGLDLFGYRSPEYIKDAGTPERLDAVNADWESGRIARGSLSTPAPAIFLDRDGTINRLADYVRTADALQLLDGVGRAIRAWNSAGWRVVVVSNQPVIARGDCTEDGLLAIHNRMETLLGREGAYVDRIYYCPHHPDGGFPGERTELKFGCDCRKPATALIEQARLDLNIDMRNSWMIGDSTTDIRTARNAGIRSILVQTGNCGRDGLYPDAADLIAPNLLEAMPMTSGGKKRVRTLIISQTPLRMSFVGGGSDFPNFYRRYSGAVVSTTIDKFIYIAVNRKFDSAIRVSYSKTEEVDHVDQVEHNFVRESLRMLGIPGGVEITSVADVPSRGTGLGSSSAFTVGLLHALHGYRGEYISREDLAAESSRVEIELCGERIGKQDQYAAAFGGLNFMRFDPDDTVTVYPIICPRATTEQMEQSLLVFFTGITRATGSVTAAQSDVLAMNPEKRKLVQRMVSLAHQVRDELQQGRLDGFGEVLHENWMLKKELTHGISNGQVDQWYEQACRAGASGGKLLGAGAGGFLLFYAPPERHPAIEAALDGLRRIDFRLEPRGSRIILYQP